MKINRDFDISGGEKMGKYTVSTLKDMASKLDWPIQCYVCFSTLYPTSVVFMTMEKSDGDFDAYSLCRCCANNFGASL